MAVKLKYSGPEIDRRLDLAGTALQEVPRELITSLDNKVDKVEGKQLSSEDFTSSAKTKLEGLRNYDDTKLVQQVSSIEQQISRKQDEISDLATIRSGAAKGATALQSYTEQYQGTVTGVKINEVIKNPSNGIVDLGSVITSHQDISGKQDKLVNGENIKTINGESILGGVILKLTYHPKRK